MNNQSITAPYKVFYGIAILLLAAFVVTGTLTVQENPSFRFQTLYSHIKQPFYSLTYAFSGGNSLAAAWSGLGSERYVAEANTMTVPVLVYHGVLSNSDDHSAIDRRENITEAKFREQMFALKRAGYETITLDELYAFGQGETKLPNKSVVITFDDGRSDSFYRASPILGALDYSAVMFAVGKFTEEAKLDSYYLSPEELKMMYRTGRWEIGSHSYDGHGDHEIDAQGTEGHFFSNYLWDDETRTAETKAGFRQRINADMERSREYLQELLGTSIASFAFPFGDFGQHQKDQVDKEEVILEVASDHYSILFYQYRPGEHFSQFFARPDQNDTAIAVRRIDVNGNWSGEELLEIIKKGSRKTLPYRDSFERDNGWVSAWGSYSIDEGVFSMKANPDQTGAAAILDGTVTWEDYELTANVESPNQTGVLVWARFIDEDNNAACNFGEEFAHVEQVLDGEKRVIKGERRPDMLPEGPFTISVHVSDRVVECRINGETLVSTSFLDRKLSYGGIGVKIWDPELGNSEVKIYDLVVEPVISEE